MRCLVAIPVYNEARHLPTVLARIREHASDILVIDDGSTDATPRILGETADIDLIRHARNKGYGRSIRDAFRFAVAERYDWVITIDCDEQHEPEQHELTKGSVLVVQPGTALQLSNRHEDELRLFIVGAPPQRGESTFLDPID